MRSVAASPPFVAAPTRLAHSMVLIEVVCPDGVYAGEIVFVARPSDGMNFEAAVPFGIEPGDTFSIDLPDAFETEPFDATSRLSPEHAQALLAVQTALRSFEPLSTFVESNCQTFADFRQGCEMPLEWNELHRDFVKLVEARIEQACSSSLGGSHVLYALVANLQTGAVGNEMADNLVEKLLSLGDFNFFCAHMQELARTQSSRRQMARGYPIVGSHMPPEAGLARR